MPPKINILNTWTVEELESLLEQKNACVIKETIKKHIPMYSVHLTDIKKSFQDILNALINTFDQRFNGLILSWKNPKMVQKDRLSETFYDVQFVHVDLEVDFYIFQPKVGGILTGVINKKEENYIGVLMHKTFNVSITKNIKDDSWPGHFLKIGQKTTFRVTQVDLKAKIPFIRGELLSNKTEESDEEMDCAEEEIEEEEEGGTELDSGYQESENETKPSTSKSASFIAGADTSESEEEEREVKVKKKIKIPQEQTPPESPVKSPVKSKKRKHEDDESPKVDTKKKPKRVKVDESEKDQGSSNITSKPKITQDEVLLGRNVSIKSESNTKKVAHDMSDSEEDQSVITHQVTKNDSDQEMDDEDDIPHDHSQSFGRTESPVLSSEEEPPKVFVNKSPEKVEKAEKKSKKKGNFIMSQESSSEDEESPGDSQAFGKLSQDSSDEELEIPKRKVDKSPEKLESKEEKKSKKNKSQDDVKSENQSQSNEVLSQKDEDEDLQRNSQAFGKLSQDSSDEELEIPKRKVDKSPEKLESKEEKKSKKSKSQDDVKIKNQSQSNEVLSQEDEDEDLQRNSQAFGKLSQDSSDEEPEIPKIVDKSPEKEKKSKKRKSQDEVFTQEEKEDLPRDSQAFGNLLSQVSTDDEEDIPRDHSQFVREVTPESDIELQIPAMIVDVAEMKKIKIENSLREEPEVVVKKPRKKKEVKSSEELAKKKVEKKPMKKKDLSPEEIENIAKHCEECINQVVISQDCRDQQLEDSDYDLLVKLVDPDEELKGKKKPKPKESKKAKPLGNSTVIESQLDSPDVTRVQEPSVSPVMPEPKPKKSKSKKVEVQPQSQENIESSQGEPVVKKSKKSKKSKEQDPEVGNSNEFLAARVKEEPKAKKSRIEPEAPVVNGMDVVDVQENEKLKKKKSKKIVQEEDADPLESIMMNAIDRVLNPPKNPMMLGGFSDSDDDLPDQPIVLSSVKVEKTNELVNGEGKLKKSKKSNKDLDSSVGQEELNESVVDTSRVKDESEKEKKKKKKKPVESLENSINEQVSSSENSSRLQAENLSEGKKKSLTIVSESLNCIEVDMSIIKKEKKKKKKKSVDGMANPIGNSQDSIGETLNSSELQMSVIEVKEESKKKKSKSKESLQNSKEQVSSDDSSRLQAENSSEKNKKSSEFLEPQVISKSKKNSAGVRVKEEPASDVEGSSKKSKNKETDKSTSKKITIKQEVIIKQEDKKKKKNKDNTINLSDVKNEAASDTEGPAAKKKINKLVFTE